MVGFRVLDWASTQARSRRLAEGRPLSVSVLRNGRSQNEDSPPSDATNRLAGLQILSKISR
jgi:hypothetical protein